MYYHSSRSCVNLKFVIIAEWFVCFSASALWQVIAGLFAALVLVAPLPFTEGSLETIERRGVCVPVYAIVNTEAVCLESPLENEIPVQEMWLS